MHQLTLWAMQQLQGEGMIDLEAGQLSRKKTVFRFHEVLTFLPFSVPLGQPTNAYICSVSVEQLCRLVHLPLCACRSTFDTS